MRARVASLFVCLLLAIPLLSDAAPSIDRSELVRVAALIANEEGIDPRLVHALIMQESNYNPRAVSRKGAQGLMQLMPATQRRLGVTDPFDPSQNVRAGVRELRRLLNRFAGDVVLSLAAYNAGEGAVGRYHGVPPYRETIGYVNKIMSNYTGAPYRVGRHNAKPVRLLRDPASGTPVISNVGGGSAIKRRPSLQGGFGK